jgi:putative ABC transport system substrate-binding protein
MKRREFIAILGGAAATWPLAARAQQANMRTIGVLVRAAAGWQRFWKLFPEALRELGYVEKQNVRFEFRSDDGQMSRLPQLAAELARSRVDVIVPWFTPAAVAAKQATSEIPIVCALCGDMVGTGLVESLARPGGNVTGISGLTPELAVKTVELIREILPSAHRVAVLANAPDPFSKQFLKQVQSAGEANGTMVDPIMIHAAEELHHNEGFARRRGHRSAQPSYQTRRQAGAQQLNAGGLHVPRLRLRRRADGLLCGGIGDVLQRRNICGQNPQRCRARRAASGATDEVRARDQSQYR